MYNYHCYSATTYDLRVLGVLLGLFSGLYFSFFLDHPFLIFFSFFFFFLGLVFQRRRWCVNIALPRKGIACCLYDKELFSGDVCHD